MIESAKERNKIGNSNNTYLYALATAAISNYAAAVTN